MHKFKIHIFFFGHNILHAQVFLQKNHPPKLKSHISPRSDHLVRSSDPTNDKHPRCSLKMYLQFPEPLFKGPTGKRTGAMTASSQSSNYQRLQLNA